MLLWMIGGLSMIDVFVAVLRALWPSEPPERVTVNHGVPFQFVEDGRPDPLALGNTVVWVSGLPMDGKTILARRIIQGFDRVVSIDAVAVHNKAELLSLDDRLPLLWNDEDDVFDGSGSLVGNRSIGPFWDKASVDDAEMAYRLADFIVSKVCSVGVVLVEGYLPSGIGDAFVEVLKRKNVAVWVVRRSK